MAYLVLRAKSPQEYGSDFQRFICGNLTFQFPNFLALTGETFFICATEMTIGAIYICLLFNKDRVSKFIKKTEDFTRESKLQLYCE